MAWKEAEELDRDAWTDEPNVWNAQDGYHLWCNVEWAANSNEVGNDTREYLKDFLHSVEDDDLDWLYESSGSEKEDEQPQGKPKKRWGSGKKKKEWKEEPEEVEEEAEQEKEESQREEVPTGLLAAPGRKQQGDRGKGGKKGGSGGGSGGGRGGRGRGRRARSRACS
ncbi:MAG: hypothetical protein GY772_29045, partial [bacterium]|nr:hypothetical protein [bacterium]